MSDFWRAVCAFMSIACAVLSWWILLNASHASLTHLCAEANWELPSCKDYLEKGIAELKGEKR